MQQVKTIRVRIKDKHASSLRQLAQEANFVWNFCNELAFKHLQRTGKFMSGYDLQKYTAGATKEGLLLNSATVQMIGHELVTRRKQFRKAKLAWRKTKGVRRSLGWIPFRDDCIAYKGGQVRYAGYKLSVWDSYGLSDYELGSGSFSEDARGRWYFNATVKVGVKTNTATKSLGIDLGIRETAVTSEGHVLANQQYKKLEQKLGIAQRANKNMEAKNIHAKIKNRRKDALHKFSTMLTKEYGAIFVGDVSSTDIIRKKHMAKGTYDAGWHMLKTMLEYKSAGAGIVFEEVNESYTTQTCLHCRQIGDNSPSGKAGLRISKWTCSCCGSVNDRNRNSANLICALGHERLAGGILAL
jgi:IS605 OrfB family transposase